MTREKVNEMETSYENYTALQDAIANAICVARCARANTTVRLERAALTTFAERLAELPHELCKIYNPLSTSGHALFTAMLHDQKKGGGR